MILPLSIIGSGSMEPILLSTGHAHSPVQDLCQESDSPLNCQPTAPFAYPLAVGNELSSVTIAGRRQDIHNVLEQFSHCRRQDNKPTSSVQFFSHPERRVPGPPVVFPYSSTSKFGKSAR
jgi:hypothetical protein